MDELIPQGWWRERREIVRELSLGAFCAIVEMHTERLRDNVMLLRELGEHDTANILSEMNKMYVHR